MLARQKSRVESTRRKTCSRIFDEKGRFLGLYLFKNKLEYINHACFDYSPSGSWNDDTPNIELFSSLSHHAQAPIFNDDVELSGTTQGVDHATKWRDPISAQYALESFDRDILWEGNFLTIHFALVESLKDNLSPDEIMFILMHALTCDSRVIASYVTRVQKEAINELELYMSDGYYFGYHADSVQNWIDSCYNIHRKP
jgi:hypothetical protein